MSQTNSDRDNSRRVQTHEKNSEETVRRLGTIIQSIFVPHQEPASAIIFGNGSVLENFRPAFSPDPTDCPWVSEGVINAAF